MGRAPRLPQWTAWKVSRLQLEEGKTSMRSSRDSKPSLSLQQYADLLAGQCPASSPVEGAGSQKTQVRVLPRPLPGDVTQMVRIGD